MYGGLNVRPARFKSAICAFAIADAAPVKSEDGMAKGCKISRHFLHAAMRANADLIAAIIAKAARDHKAGLADNGRLLWQLVMLEKSVKRLFG